MAEPKDLPQAVLELAQACGFHIVPGNRPMLYGPLDALAVLLDLLLYPDQQECGCVDDKQENS